MNSSRSKPLDSQGHWQAVYLDKQPDEVSWYQRRPQLSLRLVSTAGIQPDDPVIDVGGGSSTLVDGLLEKGFSDLTVLDISEAALADCRQRLGDRAAQVTWLTGDVLEFNPARHYTLWHDRALFHFMTSHEQRQAYVKTLHKALKPGGQAIIATFAIDGPKKCSGLDIVQYDPHSLAAELGSAWELLQSVSEKHLTPGGKIQKFIYCRLRKR